MCAKKYRVSLFYKIAFLQKSCDENLTTFFVISEKLLAEKKLLKTVNHFLLKVSS